MSRSTLLRKQPSRAELEHGYLYEGLERKGGARIASGQEFIEAAAAEEAFASIAGTPPGGAVLVARRRSSGPGGEAIEYSVVQYRPDRYRIRIGLVRC